MVAPGQRAFGGNRGGKITDRIKATIGSLIFLYGVVIAVAFDTFVRLYEEPTLRQTYGEAYAAYCAATPRWIPRFRR